MVSRSQWKAAAVVTSLLLYVYLIMYIKTFYVKFKKLDHILDMSLETDKRIQNVQHLDGELAAHISQVDGLYDY